MGALYESRGGTGGWHNAVPGCGYARPCARLGGATWPHTANPYHDPREIFIGDLLRVAQRASRRFEWDERDAE